MGGTSRPVNPHAIIVGWLKSVGYAHAFRGSNPQDFKEWKSRFRRHYKRCLGAWPERVPPRVKVTHRVKRKDHIRERVIFDSCLGVTVPAYVLTPLGLSKGEKRPGLLAAHGHGGGKSDVVGVSRENGDEKARALAARLNSEYGLDAVRRGYIVIAPDWIPFGERAAPICIPSSCPRTSRCAPPPTTCG